MTPAEAIGLSLTMLITMLGAFWTMLKIIVGQFKETVDLRFSALEDVVNTKLHNLENDYELLHQWKNRILPDHLDRLYENAITHADHRDADLSKRIDKIDGIIERKVLNGSR